MRSNEYMSNKRIYNSRFNSTDSQKVDYTPGSLRNEEAYSCAPERRRQ